MLKMLSMQNTKMDLSKIEDYWMDTLVEPGIFDDTEVHKRSMLEM